MLVVRLALEGDEKLDEEDAHLVEQRELGAARGPEEQYAERARGLHVAIVMPSERFAKSTIVSTLVSPSGGRVASYTTFLTTSTPSCSAPLMRPSCAHVRSLPSEYWQLPSRVRAAFLVSLTL